MKVKKRMMTAKKQLLKPIKSEMQSPTVILKKDKKMTKKGY
jgi:hypothetical protein